MVGDRRFDIEGGQANGVDTIGVCYGYGTEDELAAARCDAYRARPWRSWTNILLGDAPRARGVFISMEGVDGCGKTTQRAALTGHLQKLRLAGDGRRANRAATRWPRRSASWCSTR